MKLSVSNIAWLSAEDKPVYDRMKSIGYTGIEIAPNRLVGDSPYKSIPQASEISKCFRSQTGFVITSMQSILFGKNERLFGPSAEREYLLHYIEEAIDFAATIECPNLVFGSPKNRILPIDGKIQVAIDFFRELGEYALLKNTILSLEPNPVIYGTNFINTTQEAANLVREVNSLGFRINLDFGTVIANGEALDTLRNVIDLVKHIHISEPGLGPITRRKQHMQLKEILEDKSYKGFISLEMKRANLDVLIDSMDYVASIFADR